MGLSNGGVGPRSTKVGAEVFRIGWSHMSETDAVRPRRVYPV